MLAWNVEKSDQRRRKDDADSSSRKEGDLRRGKV